eukprot:4099987-Amphidinium_carterae.2
MVFKRTPCVRARHYCQLARQSSNQFLSAFNNPSDVNRPTKNQAHATKWFMTCSPQQDDCAKLLKQACLRKQTTQGTCIRWHHIGQQFKQSRFVATLCFFRQVVTAATTATAATATTTTTTTAMATATTNNNKDNDDSNSDSDKDNDNGRPGS